MSRRILTCAHCSGLTTLCVGQALVQLWAPIAFLCVKPPGLSDQQQHVYRSLAFLALLSSSVSFLVGTCLYLNHLRTTPPDTPALQWSDLGPWARRGLGTCLAAATASTLAPSLYLLRDSPGILAALGVYVVGFSAVCWWLKRRQSRAQQAAALQEAHKDPLLP